MIHDAIFSCVPDYTIDMPTITLLFNNIPVNILRGRIKPDSFSVIMFTIIMFYSFVNLF